MTSRSLGTLTIDLVAQVGGFVQGMDKAERSSKKWKTSVKSDLDTIEKASKRFSVVTGLNVGAIAAMTVAGMRAVDTQHKLSRSLNTTYDSISQLKKAFGDAGVDGFESSIAKLNQRLGSAELGKGQAVDTIKKLGLSLDDLAKKDAAERVATIADRIAAVSKNSQQAASYAKDLGFEQANATQLFLTGGDAIRNAGQYVKDMGLSLSELDATKVSQANDVFETFKDSSRALAQNMAVSIAPVMTALNNMLVDTSKEVGGLQARTDSAVDSMVTGFAFVADAVSGVMRVTNTLAISLAGVAAAMPKPDLKKFLASPVLGIADMINRKDEGGGTEALKMMLEDLRKELETPLPSVGIKKAYEDAKAAAEESAKKQLEAQKNYKYGFEAANDSAVESNAKLGKSFLELKAQYDPVAAAALAYNKAVTEILESQATQADQMNLLLDAQRKYAEDLQKAAGDPDEGFWQKWAKGAEEAMTNFDDIAKSVIDNFTSGFGNAFEKIVFDSQTLSGALQNLAVGMARSVVNALGQMAAQWLVYQLVTKGVNATAAAGAATAQIGNAVAAQNQAALNAYASTAGIPFVGPALAPEAAAAAMAATSPFTAAIISAASSALAGMAHDGIDSVPEDGTWLLQKGERVVAADTSQRLDKVLDKIQGGSAANEGRLEVGLRLDAGLIMTNLRNDDDFERTVVTIMRRNR